MPWTIIIPIAVLAAVAGFAAYCLSCALHVWRKRNRPAGDSVPKGGRPARLLGVLAGALMIGGALLAVFAVLAALLAPREGPLHGEEVLTIRLPENLRVAWTTKQDAVEKGDTLVRFTAPEHEAEIRELRLRLQELRAQRQALQKEPLEPDPEIARKLAEVTNERRHLRSSLVELEIEKCGVDRMLTQERVSKQDQISQLSSNLVELEQQQAEAGTVLEFNRKQLQRSNELMPKRVTTEHDHEQWLRDVAVTEDRFERLRQRAATVQDQRSHLQQGLAKLSEVLGSQSRSFSEQIELLKARLSQVEAEYEQLDQQLLADLKRAAELHERRLAQIAVQMEQTQAKLEGMVEVLEERASCSGHVVYRAPSPRTAKGDDPILVLAPNKGFRLRLRLPVWQRPALERREEIALQLLPPTAKDGQPARHFVERRFTGTFTSWTALPDDPWYGISELVCMPPAEAVEELAAGEEVLVMMRWWVPLMANPIFVMGLVLCGSGGLIALAVRMIRPRRLKQNCSHAEFLETDGPTDPYQVEYGPEGAMLQLLGSQLRESVRLGRTDPHVLAAAEWALDRHRARAIRLMAAGFGEDDSLDDRLRELVRQSRQAERRGTNGVPKRADLRRLMRLLQTISGEQLRGQTASLLQRLDRPVEIHNAECEAPGLHRGNEVSAS